MTIGNKIKKIRELRNFTQEHLADKIGISIGGYGKIERDETDIPYSRLEKIAETLKVRVADLVNFDEKNIFNNYGEMKDNSHINFACTINEARLYEDKIRLLEDKINYLLEKFDIN